MYCSLGHVPRSSQLSPERHWSYEEWPHYPRWLVMIFSASLWSYLGHYERSSLGQELRAEKMTQILG